MEISYGLVNLMYFMLCSEHWRIKGSRSNKRRKFLTCFTNSLFKVYDNLSLRETGPEVYNRRASGAWDNLAPWNEIVLLDHSRSSTCYCECKSLKRILTLLSIHLRGQGVQVIKSDLGMAPS